VGGTGVGAVWGAGVGAVSASGVGTGSRAAAGEAAGVAGGFFALRRVRRGVGVGAVVTRVGPAGGLTRGAGEVGELGGSGAFPQCGHGGGGGVRGRWIAARKSVVRVSRWASRVARSSFLNPSKASSRATRMGSGVGGLSFGRAAFGAAGGRAKWGAYWAANAAAAALMASASGLVVGGMLMV
jgi:hypothetical protein